MPHGLMGRQLTVLPLNGSIAQQVIQQRIDTHTKTTHATMVHIAQLQPPSSHLVKVAAYSFLNAFATSLSATGSMLQVCPCVGQTHTSG